MIFPYLTSNFYLALLISPVFLFAYNNECRRKPNCTQRKTGTSYTYTKTSCPIRSCSCLAVSAWLATAVASCLLHARSFRPGEATATHSIPKSPLCFLVIIILSVTCVLAFPSLVPFPVPPTSEHFRSSACSSCAAVLFPLETVTRQFGRLHSDRYRSAILCFACRASRGSSSTAPHNLGTKPRSENAPNDPSLLSPTGINVGRNSAILSTSTTDYFVLLMRTPSRTAKAVVAHCVYYL